LGSGDPPDLTPYLSDFSRQNSTFTQAELDLLATPPKPSEPAPQLTREDLLADAETFFTLLKTTYGAYEYFGGDETFDPILETVQADLQATGVFTAGELEHILSARLSPVLVDGHFRIGSTPMRDSHSLYLYCVPGLYFDTPEGLDKNYVNPTIAPDGHLSWWYSTLSADGRDLPGSLDGQALPWRRMDAADLSYRNVFAEETWEGVPALISRHMSASGETQRAQLQRFAACGGEYADSPLLIFDLRGNGGGSDQWAMEWFKGWTGQWPQPRGAFAHRLSQLSCHAFPDYYPAEEMGSWRGNSSPGGWVEREGLTFVLTDKGVASSGESAVTYLRTVENALFVGGPTLGCDLTPNNLRLYLPNSRLELYFGTGLSLGDSGENIDGRGYLPDLWVDPNQAPELVSAMIQYYGLAE